MTSVCDTAHAYVDTQCCKVTEIYCGNRVEKGYCSPGILRFDCVYVSYADKTKYRERSIIYLPKQERRQ